MKKHLLPYLMVFAGSIILFSWVLYPTGSPGGKSGSPGDGFANCTDCHAGTPQQANSWISSDIPVEGYLPDSVYTITATAMHSGAALFGFELTAEDLSADKTGIFTITEPGATKLVNSSTAVTHTSGGTSPSGDSRTWSVQWTAPPAGTGQVTFYSAFNAANGNGSNSGDVIYLSSTAYVENQNLGTGQTLVQAAGLRLFPNPATEFAYVTWNGDTHQVSEIEVYSLAGSRMLAFELNDSRTDSFRLPLDELAPGVYVLRTVFSNGEQTGISLVRR